MIKKGDHVKCINNVGCNLTIGHIYEADSDEYTSVLMQHIYVIDDVSKRIPCWTGRFKNATSGIDWLALNKEFSNV